MDTTCTVPTPLLSLLLNIVLSLFVFSPIPYMHYNHAMLVFLAHLLMHGSLKSHRHHRTISQSQKTICCSTTTKLGQLLSNLQPSSQSSKRQEFIPLMVMIFHYQPLSQPRTLLLRLHNHYQLSYHQSLFQHQILPQQHQWQPH